MAFVTLPVSPPELQRLHPHSFPASTAKADFAEHGWKTSTRKKSAVSEEKSAEHVPDVLEPYWNVAEIYAYELSPTKSGIAVVTPTDARDILSRPLATVPQAILRSSKVSDVGVYHDVPVNDGKKHIQLRKKYLFQTGSGIVVMNTSSIEKGGRVQSRTIQATVNVNKNVADAAIWEACMNMEADNAIEAWIVKNGLKVAQVRPYQGTMDGRIRAVVRIPAEQESNFLRISGNKGVWTGNFIETDADRNKYSIIPMPGMGREEVQKIANGHGAHAWGIVPMKRGEWGVRVLTQHTVEMAKLLRPEDHRVVTGPLYEISNLPTWMSEEGLGEFLGPSNTIIQVKARKEVGYRETARLKFLVKTSEDIVWRVKQGETFLAACKVVEKDSQKRTGKATETFKQPPKRMGAPSVHVKPVQAVASPVRQVPTLGKRSARDMEQDDAGSMQTDAGRGSGEGRLTQQTEFVLPAPVVATQPTDMMAILQSIQSNMGAMQAQLGHLQPMNDQLQRVAKGLDTVTNKVSYMEAQQEDSDYNYDEELANVGNEEYDGLVSEGAQPESFVIGGKKKTRSGRQY